MSELIAIGKIERPFGVRGAVHVRSLSDVPGRFEGLREVVVTSRSGETRKVRVRHVRAVKDGFLVSFEGMTSPEEVRQLCGGLLHIHRTEVPTLPGGHFFESDLVGLSVYGEADRPMGTVVEILEAPSHHIFVIRAQDGEELLLPAVLAVVKEVDLGSGIMRVNWNDCQEEAGTAHAV